MNPLKIKVIIGSTRPNRFSEKPAHWIVDEAKKKENVEVESLDLRDYPMPFFDAPVSPSMNPVKAPDKYENEVVKKWSVKIEEADAFIVVSPEYNHGYPAVLKNAFDSIFTEWHKKAIGFISYGGVGGARAVEQLRQVAIELKMAPIRPSIHIFWDVYMSVIKEPTPVKPELFAPVQGGVDPFLSDLIWTARALKTARES